MSLSYFSLRLPRSPKPSQPSPQTRLWSPSPSTSAGPRKTWSMWDRKPAVLRQSAGVWVIGKKHSCPYRGKGLCPCAFRKETDVDTWSCQRQSFASTETTDLFKHCLGEVNESPLILTVGSNCIVNSCFLLKLMRKAFGFYIYGSLENILGHFHLKGMIWRLLKVRLLPKMCLVFLEKVFSFAK